MQLEATVEDLAPRLFRYCLGLTRSPAMAEDAAQDALTALVDRWRRLGPPENPAFFALAIARRRALRARVRSLRWVGLDAVSEWRDSGDPESRLADAQAARRLLEALAGSPRRDREALLLVGAAELRGGAAAKLLGISRSALKMRLLRARARLREALEERP